MSDRAAVSEVIVDLIRERNGLLEERREAEPESWQETHIDGKRQGIEMALDALSDIDDWDLPEWGVAVENFETEEWEWYYPRAVKREAAVRDARKQAREDLGDELNVYQVDGPMPVRTDGGQVEEERSMMFVCGNCGTGNPIHGRPSEFEGRIFSCEGCGENVLLNEHLPEPPERQDTDIDRPQEGDGR